MDKGNSEEKRGKSVSHKDLRLYLSWIEKKPGKLLEHFPRLSFAKQLGILLFTSGSLRQQLIISSPRAEQLVRSLPESEVFITLKEIGLADAHPLLSLMTSDQMKYAGDLEVWTQNTFHSYRLLDFMKHINQCGEDKLAQWLEIVDPELLVLLLQKYGSVSKFDVHKDPVESSDDQPSTTHDGYYHFHTTEEDARPFLESILRILSVRDPARYATILESAYRDFVTEVEEDALRWREARLAEKGIPGFEEASEIYRFLADEEFSKLVSTVPLPETTPSSGPVMYPIRWLPTDSFILNIFREISDSSEVDRIRRELATIANKVIVADGIDIWDLDTLKGALGKVTGYLTIALSYLAGNNVQDAAAWMSRTWIHFLFRLGYSQILKLAKRARRIRSRVSFRWIDQTLYLPDTPMEETFRGLLRPCPLFFEMQNTENFLGFREFTSMDDITRAERQLIFIESLAEYFDNYLSLPPETIKTNCLTGGMGDRLYQVKWSHVLATLWAQSLLHHTYMFQPLTSDEVHQFIQIAFATEKTGKRRLIQANTAEAFLKWLEAKGPKDKGLPRKPLHNLFLRAVRTVEEELGNLDPSQPVDPRFLKSLCVSLKP